MTDFTTLLLWAGLAAAPPFAAVPYQTLGTEPAEVARVSAALREEVLKHGWSTTINLLAVAASSALLLLLDGPAAALERTE